MSKRSSTDAGLDDSFVDGSDVVSSDEEELATDEDSVGSLENFIAPDDDIDAEESSDQDDCTDQEDTQIPYEEVAVRSVLLPLQEVEIPTEEEKQAAESIQATVIDDQGRRRSTRTRKPVVYYVDPEFEQLMLADVDTDAVCDSGSDSEESLVTQEADEDEEFKEDDCESETEDYTTSDNDTNPVLPS